MWSRPARDGPDDKLFAAPPAAAIIQTHLHAQYQMKDRKHLAKATRIRST